MSSAVLGSSLRPARARNAAPRLPDVLSCHASVEPKGRSEPADAIADQDVVSWPVRRRLVALLGGRGSQLRPRLTVFGATAVAVALRGRGSQSTSRCWRGVIALASLADELFVIHPAGPWSAVHDRVLSASRRAGFQPRPSSRSATATLVAAGTASHLYRNRCRACGSTAWCTCRSSRRRPSISSWGAERTAPHPRSSRWPRCSGRPSGVRECAGRGA